MLFALLCISIAGTPQELIDRGQQAVESLGTYSFRMHKRERIKGELHATQEIVATIRESPFAVKLEFIKGPAKGRRVLYNSAIRPREFRVREAGFLKVFGGIWIDVDTKLAKRESNHTVLEAGLGNLLKRLEAEYAKGGFVVKPEGANAKGNDCSLWLSPNKGVGFAAATTRVCTNLKTGLPTNVETFDAKGAAIETYEFFDAKKVSVPDAFFTPEGAGV